MSMAQLRRDQGKRYHVEAAAMTDGPPLNSSSNAFASFRTGVSKP
jgi:hypothetical protein